MIMGHRWIQFFCFSCICFSLIQHPIQAEESLVDMDAVQTAVSDVQSSPIPVSTQADSLDYDQENNILIGKGNVHVTYKDMILTCDKAYINMNLKTIDAEGNVVFLRGAEKYEGDSFSYNYETQKGSAQSVNAFSYPWYGEGAEVIRHSEEEIEILDGKITTCDYEKPHYYFKAKRILIFPNKKIIAYNAFMLVHEVPILYFPVLYFPLRETQWSVVVGNSDDWGAYILTSYPWLHTEYVDSRVHLDYREERGFAGGLDIFYQLPTEEDASGSIEGYAMHDKARELSDGTIVEENRYKVELQHTQYFDEDTLLRGEFNKYSDEDFLIDFFKDDAENDLRPNSYLNISRSTSRFNFSLHLEKQVNDFYSTVERLPEGFFGVRTQRILDTPFFYKSQNLAGYLNREFAYDSAESYDAFRVDTFHEISYPKKYLGWLDIIPRFGERGSYYSDSIDGDNLFRGIFHGGVEFGTRMYKIMEIENDFWDIHRLRHVIEPRIGYIYVDKPTIEKEDIYQFDLIDAISRRHSIRLSLRNKLQTKRLEQNWDLFDFLIYTDYFIETYADPADEVGNRDFSNIFFDLEFNPFNHLALDFRAIYDQYDSEFDIFNADVKIYKDQHWYIQFGYRFRRDDISLATYNIGYTFNENWSFAMYQRYEMETGLMEDQEYTLFRNLHCWDASITYRETGEEEKQIFIAFWLNHYPNLPIGVGN